MNVAVYVVLGDSFDNTFGALNVDVLKAEVPGNS